MENIKKFFEILGLKPEMIEKMLKGETPADQIMEQAKTILTESVKREPAFIKEMEKSVREDVKKGVEAEFKKGIISAANLGKEFEGLEMREIYRAIEKNMEGKSTEIPKLQNQITALEAQAAELRKAREEDSAKTAVNIRKLQAKFALQSELMKLKADGKLILQPSDASAVLENRINGIYQIDLENGKLVILDGEGKPAFNDAKTQPLNAEMLITQTLSEYFMNGKAKPTDISPQHKIPVGGGANPTDNPQKDFTPAHIRKMTEATIKAQTANQGGGN